MKQAKEKARMKLIHPYMYSVMPVCVSSLCFGV